MKIDCTKVITTLAGPPYKLDGKELTLGDVIAEALATEQSGGKMKLYSLAQKAVNAAKTGAESMDVDAADLALIKRSVEGCKSYAGNAIILGQSLALLEEVKAA